MWIEILQALNVIRGVITHVWPFFVGVGPFLKSIGSAKSELEAVAAWKNPFKKNVIDNLNDPSARDKAFEEAEILNKLIVGFACMSFVEYLYKTTVVFLMLYAVGWVASKTRK